MLQGLCDEARLVARADSITKETSSTVTLDAQELFTNGAAECSSSYRLRTMWWA
jgi:hypothetical protein